MTNLLQENVQIEKVKMVDVLAALKSTNPSGNGLTQKYEQWQSQHGSTLAIME